MRCAILGGLKRHSLVLLLLVAVVGCMSGRGVKTIDQLAMALRAKELTVEKIVPSAEETALVNKFRA